MVSQTIMKRIFLLKAVGGYLCQFLSAFVGPNNQGWYIASTILLPLGTAFKIFSLQGKDLCKKFGKQLLRSSAEFILIVVIISFLTAAYIEYKKYPDVQGLGIETLVSQWIILICTFVLSIFLSLKEWTDKLQTGILFAVAFIIGIGQVVNYFQTELTQHLADTVKNYRLAILLFLIEYIRILLDKLISPYSQDQNVENQAQEHSSAHPNSQSMQRNCAQQSQDIGVVNNKAQNSIPSLLSSQSYGNYD